MNSDEDDSCAVGPPMLRNTTGAFGSVVPEALDDHLQDSQISSASPVSPSSFRWDRAQSFRLYAVSSKSMLRRPTNNGSGVALSGMFGSSAFLGSGEPGLGVSGHHDMNARETTKKATATLRTFILANGQTAVSTDSTLPVNIRRGPKIGAGGYANVYSGINTLTGELVAIKEILVGDTSKSTQQCQDLKAIEQEFALLRKLRHPNVIQYLLFEHSISQGVCRIVMEFMSGGSAQQILMKFGALPEVMIRKWAEQLFKALVFIHAEGIIHRDIKPANILIHGNGTLKVADFGCSKRITEINPTSHLLGTPVYMAPEFIKGQMHRKSDIWAAGCTLLELASGQQPWSHTKLREPLPLMFHISASLDQPQLPAEISEQFKSFLRQCFERDLNKRPEATDLMQHPWFTNRLPEEESESQRAIEELGAEQCSNLCEILTTTNDTFGSVGGGMPPPPAMPDSPSKSQMTLTAGSASPENGPLPGVVSSSVMPPPAIITVSQGGSPGSHYSTEGGMHVLLPRPPSEMATCSQPVTPQMRPLTPPPPSVNQFFQFGTDGGVHLSTAVDDGSPERVAPKLTNGSEELMTMNGSRELQPPPMAASGGGNSSALKVNGPVHMQVPVEALGRHMQLDLEVLPGEIEMRMIDRRPSMVVTLSHSIRSQIQSALLREASNVASFGTLMGAERQGGSDSPMSISSTPSASHQQDHTTTMT